MSWLFDLLPFVLGHWGMLAGVLGVAGGGLAFIPFAGPVLAFVAGNWRVLLVVLLVLVAAGGVGFGFYERSEYYAEKAARAADQAAAENAAREAAERDAIKTAEIENAHAAEVAQLKEGFNDRETAIAAAPATDVCNASAPVRALFDGLRHRPGAPGAGQPRAAGAAAAGAR